MPQQFNDRLTAMMKQVDALFAPEVVTFIQSDNGGPMQIPIIDDAGVSAINVSEGVQITEVDPGISQQLLPMAPLWRSKMIKASIELIQDSGYPLDEVLADRFGISPRTWDRRVARHTTALASASRPDRHRKQLQHWRI